MRLTHYKSICLAGLLSGTSLLPAAEVLLAVDINGPAMPLTEESFVEGLADGENPVIENTQNGITSKIFQKRGQKGRVRKKIDSNIPYGDFYRDFASNLVSVQNDPTSDTISIPSETTILISGLQSQTRYQITLWSVDLHYSDGCISNWFDITAGIGDNAVLLGSIKSLSKQYPTSLHDFGLSAYVTADIQGEVHIGLSFSPLAGSTTNSILNGFTLVSVD